MNIGAITVPRLIQEERFYKRRPGAHNQQHGGLWASRMRALDRGIVGPRKFVVCMYVHRYAHLSQIPALCTVYCDSRSRCLNSVVSCRDAYAGIAGLRHHLIPSRPARTLFVDTVLDSEVTLAAYDSSNSEWRFESSRCLSSKEVIQDAGRCGAFRGPLDLRMSPHSLILSSIMAISLALSILQKYPPRQVFRICITMTRETRD